MSTTLVEQPRVAPSPAEPASAAPIPPLADAALRGARATAIAHFVRVALGLATTCVLAQLLHVADFGLCGMAAVVVGFVVLFKDLGTGVAVVQKQGLSAEALATLFWLNCGLGAAGTLLLALLAPALAAAFGEPRLTPLLVALSFALLLSGPGVVPQALLARELRFATLARQDVLANALGGALAITMAACGAGVASLVAQALAAQAAATALAWRAARFRPRLVLRRDGLAGVAGVSLPLVGFQVFNYAARNADQALLGRCVGAAALGEYGLALRLVMQPLGSVAMIAQKVLLPVCSRMDGDRIRIQQAFLRVVGVVCTLLYPLLGLAIALAEPLVLGLFGPSWSGAVPVLETLGWVAVVQTVIALTGVVYQALGRTDVLLAWGLVSGSAAVLAFWAGVGDGAEGVARAYLAATLVLALPALLLPCTLLRLPLAHLLRELCGPALLALASAFAARQIALALAGSWPPLACAAGFGAFGLAVYALGVFLFDREHAREVHKLLGLRA